MNTNKQHNKKARRKRKTKKKIKKEIKRKTAEFCITNSQKINYKLS